MYRDIVLPYSEGKDQMIVLWTSTDTSVLCAGLHDPWGTRNGLLLLKIHPLTWHQELALLLMSKKLPRLFVKYHRLTLPLRSQSIYWVLQGMRDSTTGKRIPFFKSESLHEMEKAIWWARKFARDFLNERFAQYNTVYVVLQILTTVCPVTTKMLVDS